MSDSIDKVLQELDIDTETKEVTITQQKEIEAVAEVDELTQELLTMVKDDRSKSDEIFDLFYTNLAADKDHSQASKETLARALELKIEASKNIIELLKIKARLSEGTGNKVGIVFGSTPAKKVGIDLDNIRANLKNE
jgi:ATP-dependent Lon protease